MAKWLKQSYDEEKMNEKVLRPYTYVQPLRVYGFVTTKVPDAFNYWFDIPKNKLESMKKILVKLTNAFAIQDDVQDDSEFRRTQPASHRVFGKPLAINCAIHLYFLALEGICELGHPKATDLYCKAMLNFVRGQGTSIYLRDHQCDFNQDDYNQMIVNQTGFLIVLIVELMQLFSDSKKECEYLAKIFSIYYQIRDEYVDLKKPEAVEEGSRMSEFPGLATMTYCDDFTEGKMSVPVIQSLDSCHRDVILGILKMRTRDMKVKQYLLSLLEEAGGIDKTREILRELEADIFTEIQRLGGNPLFEDLMRDLQTWD